MDDINGQERPYLTTDELAAKIGVSARTVQRWLAETDIPHRRVGDVIRFVFAEVDEWMRHRREPEPANGAA
jgi:excisionase family DNA binding protein